MSHILKASFHQNYNIGLYSFANDRFCILPNIVLPHIEKDIAAVLKVPIYRTNLCGTTLLGVFMVGNNHSILIPSIVFDGEVRHLEHMKIKHHILETDHTALGNNILTNDHACIISPDLEPVKAKIKKLLEVSKIKVGTIAGLPIVGSLAVLNDKGCLVSAMASEEEAKEIGEFFGVPATRGTVNLGSPYVRAGITVNKHGFIFGSRTGGPEAVNIDEGLGFLK